MDAQTTPQASVNRYRGRPADRDPTLVIPWGRIANRLPPGLARPDGSRYESGTAWEYEDALAACKPVLVHRRMEKPKTGLDDADFDRKRARYAAVKAFMGRFDNPNVSLRAGFTPSAIPGHGFPPATCACNSGIRMQRSAAAGRHDDRAEVGGHRPGQQRVAARLGRGAPAWRKPAPWCGLFASAGVTRRGPRRSALSAQHPVG